MININIALSPAMISDIVDDIKSKKNDLNFETVDFLKTVVKKVVFKSRLLMSETQEILDSTTVTDIGIGDLL